MAYVPARGHTLLIPSGPPHDPDRKHLFLIATDICGDGDHLLVGLSSIKSGIYHDPACIIAAGSHPFLGVASYAEYKFARRDFTTHLSRLVDRGAFLQREDASPDLLNQVCVGIELSKHISRSMRAYYRRVSAEP